VNPKLGWRQRRILEILNPIVERKGWFSREDAKKEILWLIVRTAMDSVDEMAEEKRYWEAFHRLKRKGYITPVALVLKPDSSDTPLYTTRIWVKGNPYWTLTEKGRKVAHKILREEKEEEHLREALNLLVKEGKTEATLNEIREKLWEVSKEFFSNREEFQDYWTKRRLGLALKRSGIRQNFARHEKGMVRLYILGFHRE